MTARPDSRLGKASLVLLNSWTPKGHRQVEEDHQQAPCACETSQVLPLARVGHDRGREGIGGQGRT